MPGGPGHGPPRKPQDGETNGLAIAAFMTGFLGCLGVLGIVLGAIALRQISDRGGKGRGLAIAGIVLSCLWLVVGIGLFAVSAVLSESAETGAGGVPRTSETRPQEVDAKTMKVGNCINDEEVAANTNATGAPVEVESVKIVSCDGPHDGEVMIIFRLPDSAPPSDRRLSALAEDGCRQRMPGRIGNDPAAGSLGTSYYYPTTESWAQGDRAVTCVAVASDGSKLTRRIRT
ncbi:DUF4190 domain-containing protein [Actinomadura welshii]